MTVETDDPIVVMVYGALAYPSQRPALTTATDMVAGQAGPWHLADDDQARLAVDLVTRLRSTPTVGDPLVEAIAARVLDAVRAVRVMLTRFWSDDLPAPLRHEVEQLEARMLAFTQALENWTSTPEPGGQAADTDPSTDGALPSVAEGTSWRSDQWIALLRTHGVSQSQALTFVRTEAETQGLVPPAGFRQIEGNPAFVRLLLRHIDQTLTTTTAADHG